MCGDCKCVLKIIAVVIVIIDGALCWYNFYKIWTEVNREMKCEDGHKIADAYIAFALCGTITGVLTIFSIICDLKQHNVLHDNHFKKAFALTLCSYIFYVIPLTALKITYQKHCVCAGIPSLLKAGSIARFFDGFSKKAAVIGLQLVLFLNRICDLCKNTKYRDFTNEDKSIVCCAVISFLLALLGVGLFIAEIVFDFC